jgi:hypothetical protein
VTPVWDWVVTAVVVVVGTAFTGAALLTGARFPSVFIWARYKKWLVFGAGTAMIGWWPSKVFTALVAVPAPSLLGLLLARGIDVGWNPRTVLAVLLVALILPFWYHPNWIFLLTVILLAALLGIGFAQGGPTGQRGILVATAWLMLIGGFRYTLEIAGWKYRESDDPASLLQALTSVPAAFWSIAFVAIAAMSLVTGARWLLY